MDVAPIQLKSFMEDQPCVPGVLDHFEFVVYSSQPELELKGIESHRVG